MLLCHSDIAPKKLTSLVLALQTEKLSKGEMFPKIVEAYSRPTRIVRGKDVGVGVEVLEVSV